MVGWTQVMPWTHIGDHSPCSVLLCTVGGRGSGHTPCNMQHAASGGKGLLRALPAGFGGTAHDGSRALPSSRPPSPSRAFKMQRKMGWMYGAGPWYSMDASPCSACHVTGLGLLWSESRCHHVPSRRAIVVACGPWCRMKPWCGSSARGRPSASSMSACVRPRRVRDMVAASASYHSIAGGRRTCPCCCHKGAARGSVLRALQRARCGGWQEPVSARWWCASSPRLRWGRREVLRGAC
jgi:hypothetical protein